MFNFLNLFSELFYVKILEYKTHFENGNILFFCRNWCFTPPGYFLYVCLSWKMMKFCRGLETSRIKLAQEHRNFLIIDKEVYCWFNLSRKPSAWERAGTERTENKMSGAARWKTQVRIQHQSKIWNFKLTSFKFL